MNKNILYLTLLTLCLGSFSPSFANEEQEDKPAAHSNEISNEVIESCMDTLLTAVTSDLPESDCFKSPKDIHHFINKIIKFANTKTKATTALSEILRAIAKAEDVNATHFPKDLIKHMKKKVRATYGKDHKKLAHFIEKKPKKITSAKTAWKSLATGDMLIAGRLLIALKAGQSDEEKASFKKDFLTHFPNAAELYAISPNLKDFITKNSKKLTTLSKKDDDYEYDKMSDLFFSGKIEEAIKHASKNVIKGDRFVSLFFLESLAGLGLAEAIKELDHVIATLKDSDPKVETYMKNTFFKEYYSLYGRKHYIGGSPKKEAKKPSKDKGETKKPATDKKSPKKAVKEEKKTRKNEESNKKDNGKDDPNAFTIEAGFIENQEFANTKCPQICTAAVSWSGQYGPLSPHKTSVCGTSVNLRGAPNALQVKVDFIENQIDAMTKCMRAVPNGLLWNGAWKTTVPGKMSVCSCVINPKFSAY